MKHIKTCFVTFFCTLSAMLSSCAHGCEIQHNQQQLDEMYKVSFYPEAIPDFTPNLEDKISGQKVCRYLADDTVSKKVFSAFNFINEKQYLLYSCKNAIFVEIVALPKYLEGHYNEFEDGTCSPKFNPLGLRRYRIELETTTNEIVELRRLVD